MKNERQANLEIVRDLSNQRHWSGDLGPAYVSKYQPKESAWEKYAGWILAATIAAGTVVFLLYVTNGLV